MMKLVAIMVGLLFLAPAFADDKAGSKMITGCLSKGTSADSFQFTDKSTGKQINVVAAPSATAESVNLEKHAMDHEVTLKGKYVTKNGKNMFEVTQIQHVSDTCTPKR